MHIGICGPISTSDVKSLLYPEQGYIPSAMQGSSLVSTLVHSYIKLGHTVSLFSVDSSLRDLGLGESCFYKGEQFNLHLVRSRRRAFAREGNEYGRMVDLFGVERRGLVRAIKDANPEVVHAHWQYEYAWAALDSKIPCLITCHDAPLKVLMVMPDLYRLGRLIIAIKVLRRAQNLTIVSPYLSREISWFTDKPLQVVPNPIPEVRSSLEHSCRLNRFDPVRPKILMVLNSTHKMKNAGGGFEAFKILKRKIPNASLEVVGHGYQKGGIGEIYARQAGVLDEVKLSGGVPYTEVLEKMCNADILLHPSHEESFGMTIAEAMSVGLPVVAGKYSGAVPWLLGPDIGALVDVKSASDMAAAMFELINSPERYRNSVLKGIQRAKDLVSVESVAEKYISRYKEVISTCRIS